MTSHESKAENPFIPDYDDPPPPPPVVYKYVAPARTDVLRNQRIRFTPLIGTNDVFEVRQTFDRIAGPQMLAALHHEADATDASEIDTMLVGELQKLGLDSGTAKALGPAAARAIWGENYADLIRAQTKVLAGPLVDLFNEGENIERFLDRLGGSLLALSLSETADNRLMWAHYAQQSEGFVIAFDTANVFFREDKYNKARTLQKITYFDGRVNELMDDPRACLISKTTDWAYEREWRLYVKVDDADQIEQTENGDVHLIAFPLSTISRLIVGSRATPSLIQELQELVASENVNASITRMEADRRSSKLIEVPIADS